MRDVESSELEPPRAPPGAGGGAALPGSCLPEAAGAAPSVGSGAWGASGASQAGSHGGGGAGDLVFAAVALVVLMVASLVRRAADGDGAGAAFRSGWEVHGVRPALIDVNRASGDELAALPGVGPVLAGRIAACRGDGPYERLDDLARVPGVGPSVLARMAPYVVFLDGDP